MDGYVLAATDGHTNTEPAIHFADMIADHHDLELRVVHVIDERLLEGVGFADARTELEEHLEMQGRSALERVSELATNSQPSTSIRSGLPYQEILEAADGAGLIVVGRHPHETHRPEGLGVTASRVIGESTAPVLSVPSTTDAPDRGVFESVLVLTDGSDFSDRAAAFSTQLVDTDAGDLHGLYIIDSDIYDLADAPRSIIGILREGGQASLNDIGVIAREAELSYARHIRRGSVIDTIAEAVDEIDPDIVSMGTRGRSAGTGPLLGSTTAAVLQRLDRPVLTSP